METRSSYSTRNKCFTSRKKNRHRKKLSQTADFQDSDDQENLGMLAIVFPIEGNMRRSGKQKF